MRKVLQMAMLFMVLFACTAAYAQTGGSITTIKGIVSDDQGVTLPGVTVTLKGSPVNAATDINGKYSINIPSGSKTLIFSFVGMQPQEVALTGSTTINVVMKSTTTALSDVVVIGYGTQKRGDVNGAIASVTAKDIQDVQQSSVDQLLQGKAAGVTV